MKSENVHFLIDLAIKNDQFDNFTQMVEKMIDGTAQETGALGYEWFLSNDRCRCRLLETYANADAVKAHLGGAVVQDLVPKLLTFAAISRFEVYGAPDEQSAKALSAFGAVIFPYWQGMGR